MVITMESLLIDIEFNKGTFPMKHTCNGEDVSPPIRISRNHSKFLAIIIDDIIGPQKSFCHWLIWNIEPRDLIPENIPKSPEIRDPFTAVQGTNDFGSTGTGDRARRQAKYISYYFSVYGLDAPLAIPPGSDKKTLIEAMKGHMVQVRKRSDRNVWRVIIDTRKIFPGNIRVFLQNGIRMIWISGTFCAPGTFSPEFTAMHTSRVFMGSSPVSSSS